MARLARQEQGKQDILTAAAELLSTHGYHGMSMRDLARRTGMSLANLYNYFGSKEDLVFALQTRAFEQLIGTAEQALQGLEGADTRLYAFILNHVRFITANREVTRVLIEEAGELPPKRRRAVRSLKEKYFAIGRAVVEEVNENGCSGGAIPMGPLPPAEVERNTYNIFGMLNWIYGWYDPKRHGEPAAVARSIYRLVLCGLVARCPSSAIVSDTEKHVARFRMPSPVAHA